MQKPTNLLAHISLLTLNFLYALSYFVIKGVSPKYLHPNAFVLFRVLGAGLLFWMISSFFKGKKIERKDHYKLIVAAIFGIVGNQLCFFNGLILTSSVNTSIIMTTTPILILPISAWLIKEKISAFKIIGVVFGFTGALIVILQRPNYVDAANPILGNLLIFINAAMFSLYLVYTKSIMVKYGLFEFLKWLFLYGAILLLPFGGLPLLETDWASFTTEVWGSVAYVILVITFFTFILNMYAIKKLAPSSVSVYIFSQPLLTAILSYFIVGETIDVIGVMASLLIFIGVYFVAIKKS